MPVDMEYFRWKFVKDIQLPDGMPDSLCFFYLCIMSRVRDLEKTL